ncbi:NADH-quinone oxidoreductase subunit K [Opitutales bacterium]|nr:NADH-quinone oxidoreductase subunit K [Opitutales bacterium]
MFEDGSIINELFIERLNYLIYVVLLLIGLHAMIAKNNLIKKLIGMSIFQTAIILFYVSVGVKEGATIPIYLPEHDPHGSHASHSDGNETEQSNHGPVVLDAELVKGYSNPLPHVLMLTAIVVGVATLGLALALCLRIYQGYGTIEEDEILAKIEKQEMRSNPSDVLKSTDSSKQATSRSAKSVSKPKVSSPPSSKQSKASPRTKAKATSTTTKAKTSGAKPVSPKRKAAASKSTTTGSKKSPAKPKTAASKSTTKAKPKPRAKPKAKPTARAKATSTAKKATASKPKPKTPKK